MDFFHSKNAPPLLSLNRELLTELARADYDAGTPGVLPATVAQWNFQELEGSTLVDATGNPKLEFLDEAGKVTDSWPK